MCGVDADDASGGPEEERLLGGVVLPVDGADGRVEPEDAFDAGDGCHGGVEQKVEGVAGVGVTGDEAVELVLEASCDEVAGLDPGLPEGDGDGDGLSVVGEVSCDAEEVAGIGSLGEGCGSPLAVEGGDGLDHGVERIAGEGGEEVAVGVVEVESGEGLGDGLPDDRILARGEGLAGLVLSVLPRLQCQPRLPDLPLDPVPWNSPQP